MLLSDKLFDVIQCSPLKEFTYYSGDSNLTIDANKLRRFFEAFSYTKVQKLKLKFKEYAGKGEVEISNMSKDKVAKLRTAFNKFLANQTDFYDFFLEVWFKHTGEQQQEEEKENQYESNVITAFNDIPKFLVNCKDNLMK